jgi:16S rRNA (guanine966-N2)-methyltransferase
LRIISGKYRGKTLRPPKNLKVKPTTDFARESLFNIIYNNFNIEEINVLDLFSGTGSISFEFASRGCPKIHLVENNIKQISFIIKTITELDFGQIKPIHSNVLTYIKSCHTIYDIVFADPPYDLNWLDSLPELVFKHLLVRDNGWFILEHPKTFSFSSFPQFKDHRRYGKVNFSFFQ